MNSNSVLRIRIILAISCIVAVFIMAKLYSVQIIHGGEYAKTGDNQYSKNNTESFNRGSIFFESRTGNKVGVATIKDGYTVVINPKVLKNPENVYMALSQYLDIDKASFMEKAGKENDQYEEIQKRLDGDTGQKISDLKIEGVNVVKDNWRFYPAGHMASHTIGIVGYDDKNNFTGRYGLEKYYEDILSRKDASKINFFAELFSNIKDTVWKSENQEGDIISSIDPTVENELEDILKKTKETWKSDSIGGIIMNPKTGEIYAMALRPDFDPNNFKDIKDLGIFSNHLVDAVYEMGSIIKPLTMSVGLDSGAITPSSTYDDTGFMILNEKRIANYDGRARGVIPMQQVLSQSLNVGAATIALKVGNEKFSEYFKSFGLGEKTGIDQPGEVKGIISNLDSDRDIEHATASYGQGIAMSPIETIRALSILANGGLLINPHIVKEIDYSDGTIKKIEPSEGKRVIKEQTAEEVTKMLVEVVDKALRGGTVKMDNYSIAAKTGTAQIADPKNGGYYGDRYLHSFFGYFPAYNPKFIIFLYHIYPKDVEYASETLTEPFMDLTKFLINYYEIPPDR